MHLGARGRGPYDGPTNTRRRSTPDDAGGVRGVRAVGPSTHARFAARAPGTARRPAGGRPIPPRRNLLAGREEPHVPVLSVLPGLKASAEAARPQRVHRVSCAVARLAWTRGSLTLAHRSSVR